MNSLRRPYCALLFLLLALISVLFSGCSWNANARKQKYLESGQRYSEQGKYQEAAIEFLNAIRIDPRFAAAHHQLAETYLKLQRGSDAVQEFRQAIELDPNDSQDQLELANLLILNGDLQQAQGLTDPLLQKRPNDPLVHFAISNILAAQQNLPGAIAEMQKSIALDPGRAEPYLPLALLQIRNNQPDAAEQSFKKAIELKPADIPARMMLGNFYQVRGRFADAEQQFRSTMQLQPKNPEPRAALARLYVAEGKKADAEDLLKQSKNDFADNPAGYRLLADFYFANGELDKATAEYATLYQQHPNDLQVKKNYTLLLIENNRFSEARQIDDEVLKANPSDEDALVYQCQIQIANGDSAGAVQKLETIVKNAPKHAGAHYILGVAYEKTGYLERAENEWREALRLQPDMIDAERSLASAAMRTGDMGTLEAAANQLIRLQPAAPEGYALRALSNLNRKRYIESEADIRKAIQIAPGNAFGYVQLGNLKFVQKQYAEALKAYKTGLERNPNSTDALRGLMSAQVALKQTDEAIAAANAQIAKSPNNAGFYDLLGTTLFLDKKDLSGAESALLKATTLDPHNLDALLKLCQVRATKGDIDQAIATVQGALKDNPREASFYFLLGKLYEVKSDWKQAEDAYKSALAINPEHPLASNNLAKLIVQTGGNLDTALTLAQTARRVLPDSSSVADTLAWIDYQKGAYQSAIGLLLEALKLQQKTGAPDNADIHYHLGMAYAKSGQIVLARQQLERALKINPNSSAAKKELEQLTSS